ncbi:hypothetical protein LPW36_16995 [Jinshanibacter sp. LJY008]|uniref:Uncharacterized protein n=1 Tax=Limnobaculum eriocheiris TaxID=2897391 RepID=A0A9X1SM82_9GAMM|nr:hypothetical protein [Limnobaculum eriocheiris]MCD1127655.1 hypothetical protein [Limnobaculum eriocheiris]
MPFKTNPNLAHRKRAFLHFWGAAALLPFAFYAYSAPELNRINNQQIIHQQERQKALDDRIRSVCWYSHLKTRWF